jgi:glycine cleavage system H lipoate-binding protein
MRTKTNKYYPACLWTQAGVVTKKECYHDFSCKTCRFEKAMSYVCNENKTLRENGIKLTSKKQKFVSWQEKLRQQPLSKRFCIHYMRGHIAFKTCPKNYNCLSCEFDQYFQDQFKVYTIVKPVEFNNINGISLPGGYYLYPGHTWVKIEDNDHVRIGIDDFASRILGEFSKVKTPLIGQEVSQGNAGIKAWRNNNAVEFKSPVTGVVSESNPAVRDTCSIINDVPYTEGWIMRVHCKDLKTDLKNLLFMNDSVVFMRQEVDDLMDILENESGLIAADGGALGNDIYGNSPDLSWKKLVDKFINRGL